MSDQELTFPTDTQIETVDESRIRRCTEIPTINSEHLTTLRRCVLYLSAFAILFLSTRLDGFSSDLIVVLLE
jgi:hypothetical protein